MEGRRLSKNSDKAEKTDGPDSERDKKEFQHQDSRQSQAQASRCRQITMKVIDHWLFTTWMTLLTIYALFGDDLRLLATDKDSDPIFYSLSIICLFFFTVEIIAGSMVKEEYLLGFFFWLDVVATVSLIPDIGWIWDPIIGNDEGGGSNATQASSIARAGRASRAGTRAGRIIRILRVIRLIRIVKLYKISQEARAAIEAEQAGRLVRSHIVFRGQSDATENIMARAVGEVRVYTESNDGSISNSFDSQIIEKLSFQDEDDDEIDFSVPEESKVGKKLSELTTRRVIMLVLGMMFGLPVFQVDMYGEPNTSYQFGLEVINRFIHDERQLEMAWDNYISEHENTDIKIIRLEVDDYREWESDTDPDDLRNVEKSLVTIDQVAEYTDYRYKSVAVFDIRYETRMQAWLNMLKTVFVCIVLAVSSILFSNDANRLVLGPIESMITKVKKIAENPLAAVQDEERDAIEKELAIQENPELAEMDQGKGKTELMETAILENTLTKIGALLALGFGEAGSEIIASNMQNAGGDVDPMIPGKRICCIFGFCDIRQFTDTTEELQQEVMVFVNEIAYIVHSTVNYFSGSANKNVGDAFLLAWKFPEEYVNTQNWTLIQHPFIEQYSDMSIISFCKIHAYINIDPKVLKYRSHAKLCARMPGYSVKIGFGMHYGWAIQGALGSAFKIDASYLSPHVNITMQLEGTTKQFGVPILVSAQLRELCSDDMKHLLRQIDCVKVRGAESHFNLFTIDLDIEPLEPKPPKSSNNDKKRERVQQRIARDNLRKSVINGTYRAAQLFDDDPELSKMRSTLSTQFLSSFSVALKLYLKGNWSQAAEGFLRALEVKGSTDGPTNAILSFMEEFENMAPKDWKGFREVEE